MAIDHPNATTKLYDFDRKLFSAAKLTSFIFDKLGADPILGRVKLDRVLWLCAFGAVGKTDLRPVVSRMHNDAKIGQFESLLTHDDSVRMRAISSRSICIQCRGSSPAGSSLIHIGATVLTAA